ncbi:unnamed protein product, partial [Ixodes pacificus]
STFEDKLCLIPENELNARTIQLFDGELRVYRIPTSETHGPPCSCSGCWNIPQRYAAIQACQTKEYIKTPKGIQCARKKLGSTTATQRSSSNEAVSSPAASTARRIPPSHVSSGG